MNINLKRKVSSTNSVTKKPRATGFGFNDDENRSSESETEELNFKKSVQIKSQKIAKQLSADKKTDMVEIISEIEEPGSKDIPRQKREGLKYINKLLDSKKQREKDRILSRQDYNNKEIEENKDAIVFESEGYKKQQEEISKMREKEEYIEDEVHNNAEFYSKLLQLRERRNDTNDTNDNDQGTLTSEEGGHREWDILPENNHAAVPMWPIRKPESNTNILSYKTNEKDEKIQLLEKLRTLIKSNITVDDIHEYKKRYWSRYEN